jgi:hypothetical protein
LTCVHTTEHKGQHGHADGPYLGFDATSLRFDETEENIDVGKRSVFHVNYESLSRDSVSSFFRTFYHRRRCRESTRS